MDQSPEVKDQEFKSFGKETNTENSHCKIKEEDQKLLENIVIDFNKIGMQYLSQGRIEEARLLLK